MACHRVFGLVINATFDKHGDKEDRVRKILYRKVRRGMQPPPYKIAPPRMHTSFRTKVPLLIIKTQGTVDNKTHLDTGLAAPFEGEPRGWKGCGAG